MKSGKVEYISPGDEVTEYGALRIQLLDEAGQPIGYVDVSAGDFKSKHDLTQIEHFSYEVEESIRKRKYLAEHADDPEYVRVEMSRDHHEWYLRRRGSKDRYEGLTESEIRDWQSHE
jgi:hypothetical protein